MTEEKHYDNIIDRKDAGLIDDDLGEGEEVTDAAKEAAKKPPEPVPGSEGLPDDVRDGTVEE